MVSLLRSVLSQRAGALAAAGCDREARCCVPRSGPWHRSPAAPARRGSCSPRPSLSGAGRT
eukprot:4848366-Prymnesium_polylepis.1